jgi:DNA-binding NarL/FixJ family response regulator
MIDEQLAGNDSAWSQRETATQSTEDLLNVCSRTRPPRLEDALNESARSADAYQAEPLEASLLWRRLCDGSWRFVHTFSSPTRCYAILREQTARRPPEPRTVTMLALVMRGERRKVLAFDMKLSVSTVSGAVQSGLRGMGLAGRHPPPLLVMAVASQHPRRTAAEFRISRFDCGDAHYVVVSVRRPDTTLPSPLSDAEAAVIHELVSGLSYADIAEKRATSVRTVANQIAAAFRKLGVSGRQSLMERLIAHDHERNSCPLATSENGPRKRVRRAPTAAGPVFASAQPPRAATS